MGIWRGMSSGGARITRFASTSSSTATTFTRSPMAIPAFARVKLSTRTFPWCQSETMDRQTLATVFLFPSI